MHPAKNNYESLGVIALFFELLQLRLFPSYYLKTKEHLILQQYFRFYRELSPKGKRKFIRRLVAFHHLKEFRAANGFVITTEMPILISALAVRITFGLKNPSFNMIQKVMIFPGRYPNRQTGKMVAGHIGKDAFLISWPDIYNGIIDQDDGENIGYSLWAKVLELELVHGLHFDKWVADYFEQWMQTADDKRQALEKKYPALTQFSPNRTNLEILSTSIARFFEAPGWMQENVPDIYDKLCILLNHDPMNLSGTDFIYDKALAKSKGVKKVHLRKEFNVQRKFSKRYFHWSLGVMCFVPLAFIVVYAYIIRFTWINTSQFLMVFSASALIGALAFHRIILKRENTSVPYFMLFTLFGGMPLMASLYFILNFVMPGPTFTKEYKIISYKVYYSKEVNSTYMPNDGAESISLNLEKNDLPAHMRNISSAFSGDMEHAKIAIFTFKKSWLGLPVLERVDVE